MFLKNNHILIQEIKSSLSNKNSDLITKLLYALWKRTQIPWLKRKTIRILFKNDGDYLLLKIIKLFHIDEIIQQLALSNLLVLSNESADEFCKRLLALDLQLIDFRDIIDSTLQHPDKAVRELGHQLKSNVELAENNLVLTDIQILRNILQHNIPLHLAFVISSSSGDITNGAELLLKVIDQSSRTITIIQALDTLLSFVKQGHISALSNCQREQLSTFLVNVYRSRICFESITWRILVILSEIHVNGREIWRYFSTPAIAQACLDVIEKKQQTELSEVTIQQALFTLSRVIQNNSFRRQKLMEMKNGYNLKLTGLHEKGYFIPFHLRQSIM